MNEEEGTWRGAVDALLKCVSRFLSNLIYIAHGPIGAPLGPCHGAGVLPIPSPRLQKKGSFALKGQRSFKRP